MALAEQLAKAVNTSDLEGCDYRIVDVDRLTALAHSRHGSALIRVRDAGVDLEKSCDEAANQAFRRDWNQALETVWHKAKGMAKRHRWKCAPRQVMKLAQIALEVYTRAACPSCHGRALINLDRDGTATSGAAKPCPKCNASGIAPFPTPADLADRLQTKDAERWHQRLTVLVGAVEDLRGRILRETGARLK